MYEDLLGIRPNIATINEMAYSAGSLESLLNHGYNTIVMEYNNYISINNLEKFNKFSPSKVRIRDELINVIWCDTVSSQKFQKYVHGEITLLDYFEWLNDFVGDQIGAACLYCSDAEIFNFRPRRYGTEIVPTDNEWEKIVICLKNYGRKQ